MMCLKKSAGRREGGCCPPVLPATDPAMGSSDGGSADQELEMSDAGSTVHPQYIEVHPQYIEAQQSRTCG